VNYIVVYSQIVMTDGTITQWHKKVKDRQAVEPSALPSVVSDRYFQSTDQTIFEEQCMETSDNSREFPKVSRTDFDEVIGVGLGYNKLYERWVLKIPTGAHKTQSIASALISKRSNQRWR
jgi:hypothetical protein